jgi:hypothetical protein
LGSFFGNRSFVLHFANKTRITCANFTMTDAGKGGANITTSATATATPTSSSTPSSTSSPAQFTGAAVRNGVSALLVGAIGFAALL